MTSRGASKITICFFLILLGVGVYLASKLIPIYYGYFELQNQMGSLIAVSDRYPEKELRLRLAKQLKDLDIPASIDEVRFERDSQTMRIYLDYTDWLTIEYGERYYDLWRFDFHCEAKGIVP